MSLALSFALMPPMVVRSVASGPMDRIPLTEGTYVAWRFASPESGGNMDVVVEGHPSGAHFLGKGIWIWQAGDFESTRTGWVGWTAFGDTRVFVHSEHLGDPYLSYEDVIDCDHVSAPLFQCGYTNFRGTRTLPQGGGEWLVLVEATPDGTFNGSISLELPSGSTFLGRTQGLAFLDREEQFRGEVNVLAEAAGKASLKLMQNVRTEHAIGDGFFGFFRGSSDTELLRMGHDGPGGSFDGERLYLFENAPMGDYRFRVDFDLETHYQSIIAVVGAVVTLP